MPGSGATGSRGAKTPRPRFASLKAKLKQLEAARRGSGAQGKDTTRRKRRRSSNAPPAYKAASTAFDPCPAGKVCYKGVTLDVRRLGRSHRHLPEPQSRLRYRVGLQFHSVIRKSKNFGTPGNRASRRGRAGSRCWPKAMPAPIRTLRATAKSISRAQPRPRARSRPTRSIRGCASSASNWTAAISARMFSPASRGRCMSPSKVGIDAHGVDAPGVIDFELVPGFHRRPATRHPGLAGFWAGIQARGLGRKSADRILRRQHADRRHAGSRTAGGAEPESARQSHRPRRQLFQQRQQSQPESGARRDVEGARGTRRLGPYKLHVEAWRLYRELSTIASISPTTTSTPAASADISPPRSSRTRWSCRFRRPRRARPLHGDAVPGCDVAAGRHDPAAAITAAMVGVIWHTDAGARSLRLCRPRKDQRGLRGRWHGAVRLRQPALQQHRLRYREFAGGDLQRQYLAKSGSATVGFYDTVLKGVRGASRSARNIPTTSAWRLRASAARRGRTTTS